MSREFAIGLDLRLHKKIYGLYLLYSILMHHALHAFTHFIIFWLNEAAILTSDSKQQQ